MSANLNWLRQVQCPDSRCRFNQIRINNRKDFSDEFFILHLSASV